MLADGITNLDGLRVLVVEDDMFVADYTSLLLEELGCSVLGPAPSQEAAVKLMHQEIPDIALLDVNLQNDTTVFTLAKLLKDNSILIVFATGYEPRQIAERVAEPVVQKPFTSGELRRAMLTALNNGHHGSG